MPQSFKSIALVGNAKDLRVAEVHVEPREPFPCARPAGAGRPRRRPCLPAGQRRALPGAVLRDAGRAHHRHRRGRHAAVCGAAAGRPPGAAARHQSRPAWLSDRCEPEFDAGGRRYGTRRTLYRGSALALGGAAGAARQRRRYARSASTMWWSTSGKPAARWISKPRSTGVSSTPMAATASSSPRRPDRPPTPCRAAAPSSSRTSMCGCWRRSARTP